MKATQRWALQPLKPIDGAPKWKWRKAAIAAVTLRTASEALNL